MIGALLTSIVLGLVLAAALAHADDYRIDRMTMTTACAGAEPIYERPDGSFWVWRSGWRQVRYSTGDTCRWDTYPAPPPF